MTPLAETLLPAPQPTSARAAAARAAVACGVWALVHSALAGRRAKRRAAAVVGGRAADGWYRAAYNAQSVASFGALVWWLARHRGPVVYDVHGPARVALRAVQGAGVVLFVRAALGAGLGPLSGVPHAWAWLNGRPVPPMPDGQGPDERAPGVLAVRGPFDRHRQPLNLAALLVIAAAPRASAARATSNALLAAYLVAGGRHTERLLLARHGDAYARYRAVTPYL
ncbi:MAG TPA: hypothetical protein VEZ47_07070 [Gemmatirosa sp.]|nr:hypothetical protein [Gemmatirosa sp.]